MAPCCFLAARESNPAPRLIDLRATARYASRAADEASAPTGTAWKDGPRRAGNRLAGELHAFFSERLIAWRYTTCDAVQTLCDDVSPHTGTKTKRPCASLHTAVRGGAGNALSAHAASDHRLNRTTPARYGTSAATANRRPSRPDANSGSPCAACARDAASGWWRGHRCWSAR